MICSAQILIRLAEFGSDVIERDVLGSITLSKQSQLIASTIFFHYLHGFVYCGRQEGYENWFGEPLSMWEKLNVTEGVGSVCSYGTKNGCPLQLHGSLTKNQHQGSIN